MVLDDTITNNVSFAQELTLWNESFSWTNSDRMGISNFPVFLGYGFSLTHWTRCTDPSWLPDESVTEFLKPITRLLISERTNTIPATFFYFSAWLHIHSWQIKMGNVFLLFSPQRQVRAAFHRFHLSEGLWNCAEAKYLSAPRTHFMFRRQENRWRRKEKERDGKKKRERETYRGGD